MAKNDTIRIENELFEQAIQTKKSFEKYFRDNYKNLKNIYNNMSESTSFRGQACEGFLEIFEILLQYHEDINETMPQLYQAIDDLEKSLNEIKSHSAYIGLGK